MSGEGTRLGQIEPKLIGGRYKLLERIGYGGMGSVYFARDEHLRRAVAVKELRPELADDQLVLERFQREARVQADLNHPNVVMIHDLLLGEHCIVMEYLDGGTLQDRMHAAEGGRLGVGFVLEVGRQALLGLDAAHRAGLVHRDIKPGNILFDAEGRVKIADFGVVRTDADDGTALTRDGGHPGTLIYMAPEQIDGAEVDGRSDVYSLCAVLYEALTGARYFEREGLGRSERALMDAICEEPPVPLRSRAPYVSPEVEALIERGLAKDVEERPTAREMAEAIQALIAAPRQRPRIELPPGGDDTVRKTRAFPAGAAGGAGFDPRAETRAGRPGSEEGRPRVETAAETRAPLEPLRERPPAATTSTRLRVEQQVPANLERRERDGAMVVRIPAGVFTMGGLDASDERPSRRVTLDGFCIDRTPVTVGRYRRFLEAIVQEGPPALALLRRLFPDGKDHRPTGWGTEEFEELCPTDDHPVVLVDWFDAVAYAGRVGGRLPTEAEWERAARGGGASRSYPWGDAPPDDTRAIFGRKTWGPDPVGSRPLGASPEGVLDLAGNVWEWCWDRYLADAYAQLEPHNPCVGPLTDKRSRAVKRGGSWSNAASSLRVSKRGYEVLTARRPNLGFRCAGGVA